MAKGKGKIGLYGSREPLESDNAVPDSEINGEGAPTGVLPIDPPETAANKLPDDEPVTDSSSKLMLPWLPWWSWLVIFITGFMLLGGFDIFFK